MVNVSDEVITNAVGLIATSLPVGICIVDQSFTYVAVNQHFAQLLGYTQVELVGRSFADITHPDDVYNDEDMSRALFAREIPYFTLVKRWIKKDQTVLRGSLTAMTLPRNDSNWGVALILPSESTQLIERVQEISHDVNNVIHVATMAAESIESKFGETADSQAIFDAMNVASSLVNNLVSVGSQSDNRCDVATVVQQCSAMFRRTLTPSVRLTEHASEIEASVAISESALSRILINVLTNASEAIHDEGSIDIEIVDDNSAVTIRVLDTGVGIPDDHIDQATTPMFSTKGDMRRGLGLAIVHKLLDQAGGSLQLEPGQRIGTIVTIVVPK